jgi:hypothetical protein
MIKSRPEVLTAPLYRQIERDPVARTLIHFSGGRGTVTAWTIDD